MSSAPDPNNPTSSTFVEQVNQHLSVMYPEVDCTQLSKTVLEIFDQTHNQAASAQAVWTSADSILITYADSIIQSDQRPLQTLKSFLDQHVGNIISSVHVLPFYPYSSDDGFAVIDYTKVRSDLGQWSDIAGIATSYRLMVDVVMNHISSQSEWFQDYCEGKNLRSDFFIEADSDDDLSQVVRPRTSPLLRPTKTNNGLKYVWCTFGHDQIDLNYHNPEVLLEILKIVKQYLDRGASILRLDAIGYLWKTIGTTCIHLTQTHAFVRLLRVLCDYFAPGTIIITETNVPNVENLEYFGNQNEAHIIYNFSLAPLVVHSLLTGNTKYLKRWMMSMPPAPMGCTYLNFTASHDGIGMRPAEGLLSNDEQRQMVETIHRFGGQSSTRTAPDGTEKVYELNVSLFDALRGTIKGEDEFQIDRFINSQTVMMSLEGIPAFYIHSLLATPNDTKAVEKTGRNRSINRHQWDNDQLQQLLADETTLPSKVLKELLRRMQIRKTQPAFHPNATQFTLQLDPVFFAFWRQSPDRSQSIFAVHNMTHQKQTLRLTDLNLISIDQWRDLISGNLIDQSTAQLDVAPYQSLWISNHDGVS